MPRGRNDPEASAVFIDYCTPLTIIPGRSESDIAYTRSGISLFCI